MNHDRATEDPLNPMLTPEDRIAKARDMLKFEEAFVAKTELIRLATTSPGELSSLAQELVDRLAEAKVVTSDEAAGITDGVNRLPHTQVEELFEMARNRSAKPAQRLAAIKKLMATDQLYKAKLALLAIADDSTQPHELLELSGEWLGDLSWAGIITEFDTRNFSDVAADAFFADGI